MMNLTALFRQNPRPWWIGDNKPGQEGDLCVYDANGDAVFLLGDMEDVEQEDLELADLIVWASRVALPIQPAIDPEEFWKKPYSLKHKEEEG